MIIRNVVLVVFLLFSINYMCQSQESRQLRFLSEIAATAGHIKLPHNQEKLAEVIEEFDEAMENLHDFMAGSDYPIAHKIFTLYNISFWQKLSKSCQTDFKDMLIYNQSIILCEFHFLLRLN